MTTRATGLFDVRLTPRPNDAGADASPLGRLSIDKRFHGDLEGTSKGEMLSAGTARGEGKLAIVVVPDSGTGASNPIGVDP